VLLLFKNCAKKGPADDHEAAAADDDDEAARRCKVNYSWSLLVCF
jgi:hypothetical protein